MTTIDMVRREMLAASQDGKTWRAIGDAFGVTGAMAYRIAMDDYEPREAGIRHTLGLPVILPTPACPDCGTVHTIDGVCIAHSKVTVTVVEMTADELAQLDRPVTIIVKRTPARRSERRRASINLENPESAARTIRRAMDADTLALLVDLLAKGGNDNER
jgi:hypothetical protein